MKILKNKTHYTIKKGMGDGILGEIIDYHKLYAVFDLRKNYTFGLKIEDLKFILKEMEKLEREYKKK